MLEPFAECTAKYWHCCYLTQAVLSRARLYNLQQYRTGQLLRSYQQLTI